MTFEIRQKQPPGKRPCEYEQPPFSLSWRLSHKGLSFFFIFFSHIRFTNNTLLESQKYGMRE